MKFPSIVCLVFIVFVFSPVVVCLFSCACSPRGNPPAAMTTAMATAMVVDTAMATARATAVVVDMAMATATAMVVDMAMAMDMALCPALRANYLN